MVRELHDAEAAEAKNRRSGWDIVFGLSGLLAVGATIVVAVITYRQSVRIQELQSASSAQVERQKAQAAQVVQESAGKTSISVTELKNALDKQLADINDDRERSLNARDLDMKKYVNDSNVQLGRYSKQSDVDLKLVDIATELLRSDSTQANQELRHWAVDIVNSHSNVQMSKAATAEAIAGPITGEPVTVIVESAFEKNGIPTNGCEVFYKRPGSDASFRFPSLTKGGESIADLSKGPYEFWVDCRFAKSQKQQFYAQTSPLRIEFQVPPPPQP